MSTSRRRAFPVTVGRLPTVRCEICGRQLAHRPGDAATTLTRHYETDHPEQLPGR